MPDWLHNYFVKYHRVFLSRGLLGLVVAVAILGYRMTQADEPAPPPALLALVLGLLGSFLIVGLVFRGKKMR
jgi:hypothetical protein